MDYEKLIEQLKQKDGLWCSVPTGEKLVTDAADALPALLAENKKLRAELEQNSKLIAQQAAELERRDKLLKEQYDCWSYHGPSGDAAKRLAAIENILGDEYDLDRLRKLVEADREG